MSGPHLPFMRFYDDRAFLFKDKAYDYISQYQSYVPYAIGNFDGKVLCHFTTIVKDTMKVNRLPELCRKMRNVKSYESLKSPPYRRIPGRHENTGIPDGYYETKIGGPSLPDHLDSIDYAMTSCTADKLGWYKDGKLIDDSLNMALQDEQGEFFSCFNSSSSLILFHGKTYIYLQGQNEIAQGQPVAEILDVRHHKLFPICRLFRTKLKYAVKAGPPPHSDD